MSVIIVGGGMTGAILALALDKNISIDLIEAYELDAHQQSGFDDRTIALAHGSCQALEKIGLWSALSEHATAITQIQVSDKGHAGAVTISAEEYQLPALGQVVGLRQIGKQLFKLLAKKDNIRLHCPARVTNISRDTEQVTVTLDNGQQLSAELVIAADGSFSACASALKVNYQQYDYQQVAIIANLSTEKPHNGRAFERFTQHGPLAVLPMSDNRSTLVWCQPHGTNEWDDQTFINRLQQEFGWHLGKITQIGKRDCYPLYLRRAEHLISHRFALAGNAAQTLHPIAGQGFNLGLRDVITLAKVLSLANQNNEDLGCYQVLNRYAQQRNGDQNSTIAVTDGLWHLFANHFFPLEVGRNLGLIAMDNCSFIRDILTNKTLGNIK